MDTDDIHGMDEFDASEFDVDDGTLPHIDYLLTCEALEDTFLRIPGLKRSRSPESAEDIEDAFSFLNTEENGQSTSPRPETPGSRISGRELMY